MHNARAGMGQVTSSLHTSSTAVFSKTCTHETYEGMQCFFTWLVVIWSYRQLALGGI